MSLSSRLSKLESKLPKPNQSMRLVFLNPGESLESSTHDDKSNLSRLEEKIIVVRFMEPNSPC
jgi:hypothetical protein